MYISAFMATSKIVCLSKNSIIAPLIFKVFFFLLVVHSLLICLLGSLEIELFGHKLKHISHLTHKSGLI